MKVVNDQDRIAYLIKQVQEDLATEAELLELSVAIKGDQTGSVTEQVTAQIANTSQNWEYHTEKWEAVATEILNADKGGERFNKDMGKVVRFNWWVAAAAVVLLVLGASSYFLFLDNPRIPQDSPVAKKPVFQDLPPGGDKAILTLADGRQIVLDTASNGALAQQGGIKVIKVGGQVSYNAEGNTTQEVLFNTITTPKGGQYHLELADGSKVWLNAASSLHFPMTFTGKERTVELTGEGYFEVAYNAKMPFHVKVNEMDVTVLGTHFNINSYSDESSIKTTLLEGRVMVKKNDKLIYLHPGQQAVWQPAQENIKVNYGVDAEEVMAWKNGYFSFNNADIRTVMRQVARWYDIDVSFEGANHEIFSGKIDRSLSLRDLLDGLGHTRVHYRFEENRRVIILP
jgi:transmembrane sensor